MSFRYLDDPSHYNNQSRYLPPHHRNNHGHEYHQDLHYYRQQQAYYDHIRKQHYYQQNRPRQSVSMDTSSSYYHDNRDYDWYHYEQQHVPPPQQRNKKSKKVILDEDGEPLTDLEILALKNAAKNEKESKIIYQEDEIFDKEAFDKEEEDTIEGDDLNSILESLTIEENSISTLATSSTIVDEDDHQNTKKTPNTSLIPPPIPKKKRWPFSFLFKATKNTPPPTPVLSPDNDSSISTLVEQEEYSNKSGSWALKYNVPMTTSVWIKFDNENQKKIFQHIKSNKQEQQEDVIQFTDSHICNGQLPIAVVPIQMKCYIPTDITANHIASFELHFIPSLL